MKNSLRGLIVLSAVSFLLFNGCGYHFSGEGEGPLPGLERIAIPLFENETAESDLESIFAGALRREFMMKGRIQVVPEDQAGAVFRGKLTSIFTSELAHRSVEETIESRVYVTLNISCHDTRTKDIVWQDNQFTFYEEYFQNDDPIIAYENRRRALEMIAQEMAVRIHDRFLSRF